MKKYLPLTLGLLIMAQNIFAQNFDLKDLVEFAGYNVQKFDAHLGRKAFKRDYNSPRESATVYNYYQVKESKGGSVTRKFSFKEGDSPAVCFQTTSAKEYDEICRQMTRAGFTCYAENEGGETPKLFQKSNDLLRTSVEMVDSLYFYTILVERTPLPKLKDLSFAEDLLQINSHECLKEVFGEANVVKDLFYYSESEVNKCSVLYPNTSREVFFIWEDEVNYRKPAFLIIGGHLKTNGNANFNKQLVQNEWRSSQGVFPGMKLQELQEINGGVVSFYGWGTDQAGMLAPANKGRIDFNRLGLVLNCLNCNEGAAAKAAVVSSEKAIEDERRIYVSSMIILPGKEKSLSMK